MVGKFLNKTTNSASSAALLLGVFSLISRLSGLVRTAILAPIFGATILLDIYNAAFRIPDLVYNLLLGGAISVAFIPVFINYVAKDKEEAWQMARSFFYLAFIGLTVIAAGVFVVMPFLIKLVVPGFSAEEQQMTVSMSRIMLLSPLLLGLSAVFSGILHSFKKFFVYSLAPIFYNGGIIIGALFFYPRMGLSGLAWGVALGALLHMAIQAPAVFSSGFSLKFPRKFIHPAIPRVIRLMVPRALSLGAYQINLWVITAIASTIAAGALTVFTFANQFQYLPVGIIGISFATAVFPDLSKLIADNKYDRYLMEFSRTVRNVLFLVFPTGVMFYILRAQIVRITLARGEFIGEDVTLTAAALGAFSIGIFAYALMPVVAKAFFAKEDTKTPLITNIVGMVVNVSLAALLIYVVFPYDGLLGIVSGFLKAEGAEGVAVIGLPLATAIGGITSLSLLLVAFFRKKENQKILREIVSAFIRIPLISILAGLSGWSTLYLFAYFFPTSLVFEYNFRITFYWIAQATASGLVSMFVYVLLSYLFKFDELNVLISFLRTKFTKKKVIEHMPVEHEHYEDIPPAE